MLSVIIWDAALRYGQIIAQEEGAMTFAEKLKELRKQKGISQEQLAEKIYVSRDGDALRDGRT